MENSMISEGGSLFLISSVLNGLPLYFFSLLKDPRGIIKDTKKLIIDFFFFWYWGEFKAGNHLLIWKTASLLLHHGGLGVGSLKHRNSALLTNGVCISLFRRKPFGGRWWLVFMGKSLLGGWLFLLWEVQRIICGSILRSWCHYMRNI